MKALQGKPVLSAHAVLPPKRKKVVSADAVKKERKQQDRKHKDAKGKYLGVYAKTGKPGEWVVLIYTGEKLKYYGTFKNEIKAAKARDKAAISLFGSGVPLNFPKR